MRKDYLSLNLTLVLVFFLNPILYAKNLVPYEIGTRGCNWSEGETVAPDLLGRSEAVLNDDKDLVFQVRREESPYFLKGLISSQNPKPCENMKQGKEPIEVVISSGKSKIELALVKDVGNVFRPFDLAKDGNQKIEGGYCKTARGVIIYDGNEVIHIGDYAPSACDFRSFIYPTPGRAEADYTFKVLIAENRIHFQSADKRKVIKFMAVFTPLTKESVILEFSRNWLMNFQSLNEKVKLTNDFLVPVYLPETKLKISSNDPARDRRRTFFEATKSKPFEFHGKIEVDASIDTGDKNFQLVFREWGDYLRPVVSEPIRIVVDKQ